MGDLVDAPLHILSAAKLPHSCSTVQPAISGHIQQQHLHACLCPSQRRASGGLMMSHKQAGRKGSAALQVHLVPPPQQAASLLCLLSS